MGNVHASLFPSFHVRLSNVVVGNAQDVKIDKLTAYMGIGGLFGDRKEISKLVLDGVSASQEALARVPGWLKQKLARGIQHQRRAHPAQVREARRAQRRAARLRCGHPDQRRTGR